MSAPASPMPEALAGFKTGDHVRMLEPCIGHVYPDGKAEEEERTSEVGAKGLIMDMRHHGSQGWAVSVLILDGPGEGVTNVFDELDPRYPFEPWPAADQAIAAPADASPTLFEIVWAATGYQYGAEALENVRLGWDLACSGNPPQSKALTALARDIETARADLEDAQTRYLKRWGWKQTCSTPGSYWLWQRDFAAEDLQRHAAWATAGPGPLGMPSEPRAYGVITADRDLAVSMTLRALDQRPEDGDGEDD